MSDVRTQQSTLVLHGGNVALVSDLEGRIRAEEQHGLFAGDTRVMSSYGIAVNGCSWQLLALTRLGHGTARWEYQNREVRDELGDIGAGLVHFSLRRRLDGALHDDLLLQNFAQRRLCLRLTLQIDADFADLFEVKRFSMAPRMNARRIERADGVSLVYERAGFQRALHLQVAPAAVRPAFSGSRVVFELYLEPGTSWNACLEATPEVDGRRLAFNGDPHADEPDLAGDPTPLRIITQPLLQAPFESGRFDLHALAIADGNGRTHVAGGAPWFLTLFGRDTLVTGLMAGMDGPWIMEGALAALGEQQARARDDWRDAEPGKILHEIRSDELTRRGELPYSPYFGTHDAPSLYCLALWNAWRWSGKQAVLDAHLETALRALRWCAEYGDRDGDGLQEYATRSTRGYRNQSWKDAGDAVVHADGSQAEPPIATVELQGYLYAARLAMADMLSARGRSGEAEDLRQAASELRRIVEERFWCEDEGFYAFALDARKQCVGAIASNPGHLLWCGLPSRERARRVAGRLLAPDLFTGWGLRTLSADNPAYNPLSYQLGSVWPHDTALAAAGLWRYGERERAATLMRGLLEAAQRFESARLPELFCGFDDTCGFPVPYALANLPQAWAAAVPLLFVQLLLGLVPDAPNRRCFVDPWLPAWLPRLELEGIAFADGAINLTIVRDGDRTTLERFEAPGVELIRTTPDAPLWGAPAA